MVPSMTPDEASGVAISPLRDGTRPVRLLLACVYVCVGAVVTLRPSWQMRSAFGQFSRTWSRKIGNASPQRDPGTCGWQSTWVITRGREARPPASRRPASGVPGLPGRGREQAAPPAVRRPALAVAQRTVGAAPVVAVSFEGVPARAHHRPAGSWAHGAAPHTWLIPAGKERANLAAGSVIKGHLGVITILHAAARRRGKRRARDPGTARDFQPEHTARPGPRNRSA